MQNIFYILLFYAVSGCQNERQQVEAILPIRVPPTLMSGSSACASSNVIDEENCKIMDMVRNSGIVNPRSQGELYVKATNQVTNMSQYLISQSAVAFSM